MRQAILIVFIWALAIPAASAEPIANKTFTTAELYKLILSTQDGSLVFENCEFIRNYNPWLLDVPISVHLSFVDCKFDARSSFEFTGNFVSRMYFTRCNGKVNFSSVTSPFPYVDNCSFDHLSFDGCVLGSPVNTTVDYMITECELNRVSILNSNFTTTKWFIMLINSKINELEIASCTFSNVSPNARKKTLSEFHNSEILHFSNGSIGECIITDCKLDVIPVFYDINIPLRFVFTGNELTKMIYPLGLRFPMDNSEISFKQFKELTHDYYYKNDSVYQIVNFSSVSDFGEKFTDYYVAYPYNSTPDAMISFYNRALAVFDRNGDLESYDECYRILKQIEKNASHHDYVNNKNIESYFQWKMNEFLETFCDYGTNPVKSLVFSFYVILAFCIIYMLFPSEPDNLSFDKMFSAVRRYIDHFSQKIIEKSDVDFKRSMETIDKFKSDLDTHRHQLPPAIAFFGEPIHRIARARAIGRQRLNNVLEFNLYNDWHDLKFVGKMKTTLIITSSLFGFLLWGLIMRLLNAMALSMNAFVTLGYGEIEASGVARYFCVLEGILGWFLLSIFSVSLIGQILQ